MNPDHERLDAMLTRLKLNAIRDRLDTLLGEASRQDLNLRETLAYLCEAEIAHKDQRRISMGTNIAKLASVHRRGRLLGRHGLLLESGPAARVGVGMIDGYAVDVRATHALSFLGACRPP